RTRYVRRAADLLSRPSHPLYGNISSGSAAQRKNRIRERINRGNMFFRNILRIFLAIAVAACASESADDIAGGIGGGTDQDHVVGGKAAITVTFEDNGRPISFSSPLQWDKEAKAYTNTQFLPLPINSHHDFVLEL